MTSDYDIENRMLYDWDDDDHLGPLGLLRAASEPAPPPIPEDLHISEATPDQVQQILARMRQEKKNREYQEREAAKLAIESVPEIVRKEEISTQLPPSNAPKYLGAAIGGLGLGAAMHHLIKKRNRRKR